MDVNRPRGQITRRRCTILYDYFVARNGGSNSPHGIGHFTLKFKTKILIAYIESILLMCGSSIIDLPFSKFAAIFRSFSFGFICCMRMSESDNCKHFRCKYNVIVPFHMFRMEWFKILLSLKRGGRLFALWIFRVQIDWIGSLITS